MHLPLLHFSTTENNDSIVENFENTKKYEEENIRSHHSRRSSTLFLPLFSFLGTYVHTVICIFPILCYCVNARFAFLCLSSLFR